MVEQASRSFDKRQRELFKVIEKKNLAQQRLLDNWQKANSAEVKARLEELMNKNEGEIADAVKQLRVGASSFWENWTKRKERLFLKGLNLLKKKVTK